MATSIYAEVTNTILRQLETADPASWICPWHRSAGSGLPTNALTQRTYRGINVLSLWCGARLNGFATNRWATYRQWTDLGAQVRRGEKGTLVVFYKDLPAPSATRATSSEEAGCDDGPRFVAKASTVFNAAQVDNWSIPEDAAPSDTVPNSYPVFDAFVAGTGAIIRHGGDQAAYAPVPDEISMPPRASFSSADGYTATLAHELVHWTGAKHRLNRDLSIRFGTKAYAAEELVAEFGSAFVLASLNLSAEPHPNHAAYMAGWLPLLRSDPRALFTTAARASAAADYLQSLQHPASMG